MKALRTLIRSVTWLPPADAAYLDNMADEGGYPSRSALIRSLLRAIIEDDRRAHSERAA
jgi:metal-responsive CopG/Arc/MetJ family transcriptional regulator